MIRDTLEIECLVQAFQNMIEAKNEHDDARKQFIDNGGYSWGYHGHHYVKSMEGAAEDLQTRLNGYIEKKVNEIIDLRGKGDI